jgi:hypothetical protein
MNLGYTTKLTTLTRDQQESGLSRRSLRLLFQGVAQHLWVPYDGSGRGTTNHEAGPRDRGREKWEVASKDEQRSIERAGTYKLVDRPSWEESTEEQVCP